MKKDLSIIIPFAGEYPQVLFTIQSIAQSLIGKIDFEIIAVDNYCKELEDQWTNLKNKSITNLNGIYVNKGLDSVSLGEVINKLPPQMNNKSGEAIEASARGNEWLTYLKYDGRLSHWECKRQACKIAKADTFLFVDAHTVPSLGIDDMFDTYVNDFDPISDRYYSEAGTFHMPLTYKILEWRRLIYKMVVENYFYGYSFTGMKEDEVDPFEVPVMSCCGVMISREVYDRIGGWPKHMFAYGGGENFLNYSLAVTGMKKWIYPGVTLHHHGERRDYHYTYDGTLINRFVAHYLFGGNELLNDLACASKGRPAVLKQMVDSISTNPHHIAHRAIIKSNQTVDLCDWVAKWRE